MERIYLLDANVFIDAARDYYPLDRVPEFWSWIAHQARNGRVKAPVEIYEEFKDGDDLLGQWARAAEVRESLLLAEEALPELVARVTAEGYARDLSDTEIEKVGRDPFLVAAALAAPGMRAVVTTETPAPRKRRANRKLPDVCAEIEIDCYHTYEFLRLLDFRTGWG